MGPSVATNHMSGSVGVLDISHSVCVVNTIVVVTVEEEGGLGLCVCESVRDVA